MFMTSELQEDDYVTVKDKTASWLTLEAPVLERHGFKQQYVQMIQSIKIDQKPLLICFL